MIQRNVLKFSANLDVVIYVAYDPLSLHIYYIGIVAVTLLRDPLMQEKFGRNIYGLSH